MTRWNGVHYASLHIRRPTAWDRSNARLEETVGWYAVLCISAGACAGYVAG